MLADGSIITLWKIEPHEKFTTVQISTRGKGLDGQWHTDFTGYCTCVGKAHLKVRDLKPGKNCTLKLKGFGVKTYIKTFGKGKNCRKDYRYNFTLFDVEEIVENEKYDYSSMPEIDGLVGGENFFDNPPVNTDTSFFD